MDNNELGQCIDILKKCGIILFTSSIGQILAANAFNNKAVKKITEIKNLLDIESLVIAENESKLIMLLEDIPNLAYDLIENATKPLILKYDRPSGFEKEFLNQDHTISIYIAKDEIIRQISNRGIRALAGIPLAMAAKSQKWLIPGLAETILQKADYVVNLQQENKTSFSSPSVMSLKANGEIKILQK
ncbi:MAG: Sua5/YciO/YrdC/YwlC family protein [Bacteroidetes bacterium]|nr:Sua5/YciO/YrdC/YwlC family protein [Bacteroidota bacterium]HET6245116.1 Sua5/YciO/YrdC/YwlC family protein [Bacteroidia bacterium]